MNTNKNKGEKSPHQKQVIQERILNKKQFLNVKELCAFTGWSQSHVYKLTMNKELPYYKPNRKTLFFKLADIDNYISRVRISSREELEKQADNHSKVA